MTVAASDGDPKLPNCFMFGSGAWGPNAGYVYKNVPAFSLAPGDTIAFDTWALNDVDVGFDVSLAATTVNGGDIPAAAFTKVVGNTQVPLAPRGNVVVGDYDIKFTSIGSFSFPGGGLVVRFSNRSATFAADGSCNSNLVGAATPADSSGFFVSRFRQDPDGVAPWTNPDTDNLAAFRIVNAPPTTTGTVGGTAGGGSGTSGTTLIDRTKPTLGSLSFSSTTFKAASSGSAFSSQRKRKRSNAPTGTKVSFNLSEPSAVKFTVQRKTTGRRVKGKCKTRTRKNRKRRRCTLWKNVRGSFTIQGKAGKNSFTFRGRVGGKSLKPGSHRLNSRATDKAKNKSRLKRKNFRIVK